MLPGQELRARRMMRPEVRRTHVSRLHADAGLVTQHSTGEAVLPARVDLVAVDVDLDGVVGAPDGDDVMEVPVDHVGGDPGFVHAWELQGA